MSIKQSDIPIGPVLHKCAQAGLVVAPLVPTPTGMSHSIMDATIPVQALLSAAGIHDYAHQGQGQAHKRAVPTFFIQLAGTTPSIASLYRPATKKGDARIWFRGLKNYAVPGNLLLLMTGTDALYVANMSVESIRRSITDQKNPALELLGRPPRLVPSPITYPPPELLESIDMILKAQGVPTTCELLSSHVFQVLGEEFAPQDIKRLLNLTDRYSIDSTGFVWFRSGQSIRN